jgi:hypothetical protein
MILMLMNWQEFHYYVVGLDLEQKIEWTKKQVRAALWYYQAS